jgi:hypothetical protein
MLRLYLYARVRILECILHTRPRVLAGTRHSLRPLTFEGELKQASGATRREMAKVYLVGWVERSDTHGPTHRR